MSSRKTPGSRCGIERRPALLDMMPQSAVSDCAKLDQVYAPLQELLQGLLEIQEISEAVRDARLELHEQIDVTVFGIEILSQDRAKQLELMHAIKAAQPTD